MKALTAGSLLLVLGLAGPFVVTHAERPGRGADYGDSNGNRQGMSRSEGDRGGRGDYGGRSSAPASVASGRGDVRGDSRGERDLNTRIAGWEGGYREPAAASAPMRRGDDRSYRDEGRSQGRYDDSRWRNDGSRHSGYRHDNHRRDSRWDDRHSHGRHRHDDWRHPDWRRHWSHGWAGNRYRAPARYVYPRGYHAQSWRIGYRLPPVFFVNDWYVDWRYYRLAPPPWGARWLRVDGDLMLVDERSGEIIDALYGFFYY